MQWKGGVELSIFLQPNVTDQPARRHQPRAGQYAGVKSFRYVDKPHAYAEFKEMFANTPTWSSSLRVNDMPPSYRVVPTRAQDVTAIGDQFKNQPGVKVVVYAKEYRHPAEGLPDQARRSLFLAFGVFAGRWR